MLDVMLEMQRGQRNWARTGKQKREDLRERCVLWEQIKQEGVAESGSCVCVHSGTYMWGRFLVSHFLNEEFH